MRAGRRDWASCRCISPAASRRRARISRTSSRPPREAGLYTNLITAAVLLTRERLQKLAEAGLDHVQISFQDVDAENAERIGAYKGGSAEEARGRPLGDASSACR